MKGLLIFDLDGTLLNSQKVIPDHTLEILRQCKEAGYMMAISTSRSFTSTKQLIQDLTYDFLITSGGALIMKHDSIIHIEAIEQDKINKMIDQARRICGNEVEISVDTVTNHYWNYHIAPTKEDASWNSTIWCDFNDFHEDGLKVCIEIFQQIHLNQFKELNKDLDIVKFVDSYWYKFTKKNITKEYALKIIHENEHIDYLDMISFGDDLVDLGMLKLSGVGVAMGNSVNEVKTIADYITLSNDEEGVAYYLENYVLK